MTLESALNAVCDALRTRVTQLPVVIGRPDAQAERALCVWPWRMSESAAGRQPFLPMTARGAVYQASVAPLTVQFFLMASPALDSIGLQALDAGRRALIDNPVLDQGRLQIVCETLSMEELAGIFLSAHLPLGLCAPFLLRGIVEAT